MTFEPSAWTVLLPAAAASWKVFAVTLMTKYCVAVASDEPPVRAVNTSAVPFARPWLVYVNRLVAVAPVAVVTVGLQLMSSVSRLWVFDVLFWLASSDTTRSTCTWAGPWVVLFVLMNVVPHSRRRNRFCPSPMSRVVPRSITLVETTAVPALPNAFAAASVFVAAV